MKKPKILKNELDCILLVLATAYVAFIVVAVLILSEPIKPIEAGTSFSIRGDYKYPATVDKWIDGDTIDATVYLGMNVYVKERFRLYGINAWETRGEEREKGLRAKEAVKKLLSKESDFVLQTIKDKKGKYGRYLAIILTKNNLNVNKWLVKEGHAKEQEY